MMVVNNSWLRSSYTAGDNWVQSRDCCSCWWRCCWSVLLANWCWWCWWRHCPSGVGTPCCPLAGLSSFDDVEHEDKPDDDDGLSVVGELRLASAATSVLVPASSCRYFYSHTSVHLFSAMTLSVVRQQGHRACKPKSNLVHLALNLTPGGNNFKYFFWESTHQISYSLNSKGKSGPKFSAAWMFLVLRQEPKHPGGGKIIVP